MKDDLVDAIWGNRPEKPSSVDMVKLWQTIETMKYHKSKEPFRRGYEVLRLLYNEDGSRSDMTLSDVGYKVGVTSVRISQNRDRAFAMLRHPKRLEVYRIDEPKTEIEGPVQDRRPRYLVWRRMKAPYRIKDGYGCSKADFLSISARLQLMMTFDRETATETHRGCDVWFSVGGDTLEVKVGEYEVLLPWIQDQIDKAIRDNRRAILEKHDIQVEEA